MGRRVASPPEAWIETDLDALMTTITGRLPPGGVD